MGVKQLFDLSGRVALVTGGSRGLGLAMATALGEMGARIALVARHTEELDAARASLSALAIEVMHIAADLSRFDCIDPLVESVLRRFGQIDVLVNNAGVSWGAPAEDHPLAAWEKVVDLNLTSAFVLARSVAVRSMIPRRYGRIVNIASTAGLRGSPPRQLRAIAYHASKGGLVNFTRALAAEWGQYGIVVNAICPGFIPSRMSQGVLDRVAAEVIAETPLQQLGREQDLQGIALLLASDAARHITGQAIAVDGGRSVI